MLATPSIPFRTVAAMLFGSLAFAAPAWAQYSGGPNGNPLGIAKGPTQPPAPVLAPAPAIPGSHAAPSAPEAPATGARLPLDMAPNEALFDAINRGDVAAARDAIGRGADLNATNLLGLTPLELSIDLGRNEISFMLLSLRNSPGERAHQAAAAQQAAAVEEPPEHGRSRLTPRRLANAPVSAPAPALAALPESGGTPVPAAGFLGFDIGRNGR
jgi:hypothetical protein